MIFKENIIAHSFACLFLLFLIGVHLTSIVEILKLNYQLNNNADKLAKGLKEEIKTQFAGYITVNTVSCIFDVVVIIAIAAYFSSLILKRKYKFIYIISFLLLCITLIGRFITFVIYASGSAQKAIYPVNLGQLQYAKQQTDPQFNLGKKFIFQWWSTNTSEFNLMYIFFAFALISISIISMTFKPENENIGNNEQKLFQEELQEQSNN